jgi:APA family basic amino acid/polyamine antiporter
MLSFVMAGLACVFAALCYAEFASMVPVAGSAYTYAYTTLGELFAWIIGWDLVLEYAVSAATVTHGASAYFQDLIGIFGLKLPEALSRAPFDFDKMTGKWVATGTLMDSPALVVTAIVTVILVIGIKESASFNAAMVILKLAIVLLVIGVGVFYIDTNNWHPFSPYGLTGVSFFGKTLFGQTDAAGQPVGMLAGGALIFFAYIGFDSVSTHAEEARNPQRDVPIGILTSLILCTVLYIAVTAVLTGMVPYSKLDINAPVADAFEAIEAFTPVIARGLERGERLHDYTRHLHGLFAGRPGARAYRRVLASEGVRAGAGLEVLRSAVACVERGRERAIGGPQGRSSLEGLQAAE